MAGNETEWTRRIAAGDRRAYEEFVDSFGPRVHRLVRQQVPACDADDVTQEIFIDLFKGAAGFRGEAALSTWVYRIAMNHCIKRQRRRGDSAEDAAEDEIADDAPDPAKRAATREMRSEVRGAIQNLSAVQRDAVILHELHGMTYAQCAAVLDIPVGTVKSRLSNAFRALRESLHDYVQGDETDSLDSAAAQCGVAGGAV